MIHEIVVNVVRNDGWMVHFLEADCRTRVGPWLLLHSAEEVTDLLKRGNITDAELADYEQDMRRWGQTSVHIHLATAQYAKLVAEGIRRPWNGYEERQRQAAARKRAKK